MTTPAGTRSAEYPCSLIACTDFVLSTLAMTVTNLLDTVLAPLGLKLKTYRMLRILQDDGPQRQTALGAALGLDRTTTVMVVDKLEAAGFAKRQRSSWDRRAYLIAITPKGCRTLAKAIERVSEAEAAMFGTLSPAERRTLQDLATRLLTEPGTIADEHAREYATLMERRRA
ncbi:MAG: MarR family transcriptional regulator [Candidatus Eremiobacteraeota bacterium]|nr:MarR family transcriptional regulator [Candidatus Eremiobacteraeota bacterium]